MLDDRSYMQPPYQAEKTYSSVVALIVLTVGIFLLKVFTSGQTGLWEQYFFLSQTGLAKGFLWQLITFQLIHADVLHLLFNCWALYLFGRSIEQSLGKAGFFRIYFLAGTVGGLLHALIAWSLGGGPSYMVGASAGVYGLIAVFARLWPETPLMLFPFPVQIKIKHLFLILLGIAGLGVILSQGSTISHAGHFGGALAGLAYVFYAIEGQTLFSKTPSGSVLRTQSRAQSIAKVKQVIKRAGQGKKSQPPDLKEDEFISREVDPILEKISAHGIHSLTDTERKVLESARSRLSGRLRNR
jgi:membrane associated rhomboid family serine protease